MLTAIAVGATTVGALTYTGLYFWRIDDKPPGQWVAMAVLSAGLAILNAFDAALNHTGLSWLRAAMWTVGTALALFGIRDARARVKAEAYVASLRIPGGPK